MLRLIKARAARARGDEGIAIILVIGVAAVLILLATMALSFSLSGVVKAKNDQDWNAAMSAAYAGVEDYKSKLANDNTYQQYGNPAAAFSASSTVTLPTGPGMSNPAFGVGTSGSWATVQGSGGAASYRYEVDTSQYGASGNLRIRSTGRSGTVTRSVVADLKQQGFIDFLYYTDYEIQDPTLSGASTSTCVKYAWAGRPTSGCGEIAFGGGDIINGPMHSNDILRVCNATFNGAATTSYNPASGNRYTPRDSNYNPCSGQQFNATSIPANNPTYSPVITMPPTNSAMKQDSRTDVVTNPRPGCLYTGPTSIVFNADGTMTVRSPWTKVTRVVGSPATGPGSPATSACGSPGSSSGTLGGSTGQTFPVPSKNLFYVQNVPGASTDPNYWPTSGASSRPSSYASTTCNTSNGIGYPTASEYVSSVATAYGCRNGDAFVSGQVHAQATVAADNYVYITGDITYVDAQSDILGLVGNGSVWVWNPVTPTGWGTYSSLLPDNRTIDAAILSVGHSFVVQNYDRGGGQGTLTVVGAIAQKFRGIVRSGSNGYIKNYNYDERLRYIAPPKFLSPVSTSYGISVLVEVKTAMNPDGSTIP